MLVLDIVKNKAYRPPVKYKVRLVTQANCHCPDCRAGKHLYELHRWRDGEWQFVGISLQSYASAEDCQRNHHWGIPFQAEDVWEDGTPILPPERRGQAQPAKLKSGAGHKVILDHKAFVKSAEALERHWFPAAAGDGEGKPRWP